MIKYWLILLPLFILLLNGCVDSKEIESLGIINTRGIDLQEDGKLKTTIVYFQFDARSKDIAKIVFGEGDTVKGARANANYKTNFELTPGQIRLEIYGMKAAKKGLLPYLDTLARDAKVSDTMFLALSNSTAEEIITMGKENLSIDVEHYLYRLIEQTINDDIIPRTNLHDFTHTYYDVGKDPIIPMLKIKEGRPYLYAMALFKEDKYAGSISTVDAFLLNILEKQVETTLMELTLPIEPIKDHLVRADANQDDDTFSVLLSVVNGHGQSRLTNFHDLEFETNVDVEFRLLELTREINLEAKVETLLEKEIEKNIEKRYTDLLKKVQDLDADPFGYGSIYRSQKRTGKLTDDEWRNKLSDIKVKYNVNAKLIRHGITE
ncbi:Ger(x)C family spore germination protein [Virgibacillus flavescens]|uniref:Ger(x)C family spore germination protein n=1 Tax=Virgibacillus flavescens TaxID=1611422 RepID=UPI003D347155